MLFFSYAMLSDIAYTITNTKVYFYIWARGLPVCKQNTYDTQRLPLSLPLSLYLYISILLTYTHLTHSPTYTHYSYIWINIKTILIAIKYMFNLTYKVWKEITLKPYVIRIPCATYWSWTSGLIGMNQNN